MGTLVLTDTSANAAIDNLATRVNGGTVEIHTAGRTTLLATLTLSATAFGAAAARSATINTVTGTTAAAAGTAAEAVFKNSSNVEQFSGTVTASAGGGVIEFASLAWNSGDNIEVTGGTLSYPA